MTSSASRGPVLAIVGILVLFGLGALLSIRMLTVGGVLPAAGRVAIVPLRGAIEDEHEFVRTLDGFRRDGSVRAFVVEIESPGGTVGASQAIYGAIRGLRDEDEDERPVIAWMGDVAASGGFYAAMGADSVFALPGTITGSIGVVMEFPNAEELYRKVGIGWEVVKSGEHKDMGNPARGLRESDRLILEGLVQDVHAQFVDAVADNRPLGRGEVAELADGRIFSGRQAAELGLIDRVADLEEAVSVAGRMAGLGSEPRTERPREVRLGLWDLLFGVSETEARGLLQTLVPIHSSTPRLLYEWR